jgi:proteic killer suppression protein
MIKTFKNKQLEKFYNSGVAEGLADIDKERLRLILAQLDAAEELKDLKIPSLDFNKVKEDGTFSIAIGNGKRLIFTLKPTED